VIELLNSEAEIRQAVDDFSSTAIPASRVKGWPDHRWSRPSLTALNGESEPSALPPLAERRAPPSPWKGICHVQPTKGAILSPGHLLTPENSAFIIVDSQRCSISSAPPRTAVAYGLPVVHSTGNVATGKYKPPIRQRQDVLGDLPTYDRTTINSWEDVEFRKAVEAPIDTQEANYDGARDRSVSLRWTRLRKAMMFMCR
jgi:hypothetical protein